ncbi:MAG: peptide transporter ATP-binding protein [Haloplasmataceae bacterium]|jgi:oligopeptide transport system ATP-binding protein|nr:peptide transporter ATP-binding protein [Haloplasmataceae bacterium]
MSNENKEVLLSVKNMHVVFKVGRRRVHAVNGVSFDVYKGETFGLVGESGSGKTTVIRTILGINDLTSGNIYFKDNLISGKLSRRKKRTLKKQIQMIFQDPAASLNERANIDYIVSEGLYNFKLFNTEQERREKVVKALTDVGLLEEHITRYPHEFSGGQRQRIGIARALVIEPELVLADEPISALDVSIRAQVLNLMKKLQRDRDLTYLFIAHDLSIIQYISDRVGVMHNGYLVELADANEIYANPLHPYTKSLLNAIPQPDPKTERFRVRGVYESTDIHYESGEWIEVTPGHFLLGTPEQIKEWTKK